MAEAHLGILLERSGGQAGPFGPLTPFAERVAQLADYEGVAVTAFGPDDLDAPSGRLLAGYFDGPDQGWTFREGALPDVIWDRCFRRPRSLAQQPYVARGAVPINQGWLDKWQGHRLLASDPELASHLPETALAVRAETIEAMLDRHEQVFLKPVGGSVGRGIIRVSRAGVGCFHLGYVSRETGKLREAYATHQHLDRWFARQPEPYLAQQGLDLSVADGRPADVRVLVQKDGTGRWQVTGMGARVAACGRFTANLHTGGTGVPVEQIVQMVRPLDGPGQRALLADLEWLALGAAHRIEAGLGALGELGLDFGIDAEGQVWFIEQNFQPGRSIFAHLSRWDLFDLAHRRPVQYSRFLASRKKSVSAASIAAT